MILFSVDVDLLAKTDGAAATPATTTQAWRRNSRRFVSSLLNSAILFDDPNVLYWLASGSKEAEEIFNLQAVEKVYLSPVEPALSPVEGDGWNLPRMERAARNPGVGCTDETCPRRIPSKHPQNRHPERSASRIYRIRGGFMARSRRTSGLLTLAYRSWLFNQRSQRRASDFVPHLMDGYLWPESSEEHLPKNIAGVLRLRAVAPSLCDRFATRSAQDDGWVRALKKYVSGRLALTGLRPGLSSAVPFDRAQGRLYGTHLLQSAGFTPPSSSSLSLRS